MIMCNLLLNDNLINPVIVTFVSGCYYLLVSMDCPCGLTRGELLELQRLGIEAISKSGMCLRTNSKDKSLMCGRPYEQHPSAGTSSPSHFDFFPTVMPPHIFVVITTCANFLTLIITTIQKPHRNLKVSD
jgi:hypothetical protein